MTKYVQGKDGKFAGSIGDGKASVPSVSDLPPSTGPVAVDDKTADAATVYQAYQVAQQIDSAEVQRTFEWLSTMMHEDASSDVCGCPACEPSDADSPSVKEAVRQYNEHRWSGGYGGASTADHPLDCMCWDCGPL